MLGDVHAVDDHHRARRFRPPDQVRRRRDGADGVRREGEGNELRLESECRVERVEVEGRVVGPDVDPGHGGARVARRQHPGTHVRIVVETCHHHVVTRSDRARE